MISARIDVTKIDKNRLYVGAKGTYLDVVLIPTPNGKFGDYMVVESVTKEEREAGEKGTILGNGKNLITGKVNVTPVEASNDVNDELPF